MSRADEPSPLYRCLPDGFRWYHDPLRDLVALVHVSGLWVILDADSASEMSEDEADLFAAMLEDGICQGRVGRHIVQVTKTSQALEFELMERW